MGANHEKKRKDPGKPHIPQRKYTMGRGKEKSRRNSEKRAGRGTGGSADRRPIKTSEG